MGKIGPLVKVAILGALAFAPIKLQVNRTKNQAQRLYHHFTHRTEFDKTCDNTFFDDWGNLRTYFGDRCGKLDSIVGARDKLYSDNGIFNISSWHTDNVGDWTIAIPYNPLKFLRRKIDTSAIEKYEGELKQEYFGFQSMLEERDVALEKAKDEVSLERRKKYLEGLKKDSKLMMRVKDCQKRFKKGEEGILYKAKRGDNRILVGKAFLRCSRDDQAFFPEIYGVPKVCSRRPKSWNREYLECEDNKIKVGEDLQLKAPVERDLSNPDTYDGEVHEKLASRHGEAPDNLGIHALTKGVWRRYSDNSSVLEKRFITMEDY